MVIMLLQCFELNKFEGYEDEEALEKQSLQYIETGLFWSGKPTANYTVTRIKHMPIHTLDKTPTNFILCPNRKLYYLLELHITTEKHVAT